MIYYTAFRSSNNVSRYCHARFRQTPQHEKKEGQKKWLKVLKKL